MTGEQDEGYNPSNATTATRTDKPLRDVPESIQVVPQQVEIVEQGKHEELLARDRIYAGLWYVQSGYER